MFQRINLAAMTEENKIKLKTFEDLKNVLANIKNNNITQKTLQVDATAAKPGYGIISHEVSEH